MVWPLAASADAETYPRKAEKSERIRREEVGPDGKKSERWDDASLLRRVFDRSVEWRFGEEGKDEWLVEMPSARRVIPATLRLRDVTFVDDEKVAKMEKRGYELKLKAYEGERTLRTGPRRFAGADFGLVDLRRADLRGAAFDMSWLVAANFSGARLDKASFAHARLSEAQIQGASLFEAQLPGALLFEVQLQGAMLDRAQFQGALLDGARLQGAMLDRAQFQGALLDRARLQGASLYGAQLQGASLVLAQLQGALLGGAQLQGTSLNEAELQGASLEDTKLQGASINNLLCYRASITPFLRSFAGWPDCDRVVHNTFGFRKPLTNEIVEKWRAEAIQFVTDPKRRDAISARFARLKDDGIDKIGKAEQSRIDALWKKVSDRPADIEAYARSLVGIACDFGAPYVARGIISNGGVRKSSAHAHIIADALRAGKVDPTNCPGVAGFSEVDWTKLDEAVAEAKF